MPERQASWLADSSLCLGQGGVVEEARQHDSIHCTDTLLRAGVLQAAMPHARRLSKQRTAECWCLHWLAAHRASAVATVLAAAAVEPALVELLCRLMR
jgi:hypothetical protein